jgi:aminoglycoside phosphotransferase (APT) family kinase protein
VGGRAIEVDTPLVRAVLREQHPDLADLPLVRVPGGWDNGLWRLGGELAVRMPRTMRAPSLLRCEQRWLPDLAPSLPLPVPVPVRVGEPSARFPWPWTVMRWVAGEPADRAPICAAEDGADRLADFLGALHREAPADAPHNALRSVPLSALRSTFHERVGAVSGRADVGELRQVWNDAVTAPGWDAPPVWLHADLHPANVVTAGGTLAGVVDFGELCAGDPATDLAAAWLLLPGGGVPRFLEAYARADEATVRRARGWTLLFALALVGIGRAGERGLPGGQPACGPPGARALDRLLTVG